MSSHVTEFNARNIILIAKLLEQNYQYYKLRNKNSKFYRRHYELASKSKVRLKSLLQQGLSELEFYGEIGKKSRACFSDQFRKVIIRYKRIGYNISIRLQFACLVVNLITVYNFASLFNCTPAGRASSMMGPT